MEDTKEKKSILSNPITTACVFHESLTWPLYGLGRIVLTPKFPRQHRRLISDLPFSVAQDSFRTPVSAWLLSVLLVPSFPASLSPVSPYLLQEKTMVSMRCFTVLAKAIHQRKKKGGGGLFICGPLPVGIE